uniref:Uncharacterized protein n=1 Tax=Soybean thrips virga-like virus 1 TaxID=2802949 RepID=A0A7T8JIF4_9VIRU|nr:hypothetical protein 3 [Soybean thrips virga-like virus 1]
MLLAIVMMIVFLLLLLSRYYFCCDKLPMAFFVRFDQLDDYLRGKMFLTTYSPSYYRRFPENTLMINVYDPVISIYINLLRTYMAYGDIVNNIEFGERYSQLVIYLRIGYFHSDPRLGVFDRQTYETHFSIKNFSFF